MRFPFEQRGFALNGIVRTICGEPGRRLARTRARRRPTLRVHRTPRKTY
jgi:hypothetical protein